MENPAKSLSELHIGVVGGGQLGRMLIRAALDFDLTINVLDGDPGAPCAALAHCFTVGNLTDYDTVMAFGRQQDVLTIEIEAVNTEALKALRDAGKQVYPQPEIIELIQDKCLQKAFYLERGIPTAEFVLTGNRDDLARVADDWLPAVHKVGRGGYDGRGVTVLRRADDVARGFDQPAVLERLIDFEKEISVIVARNPRGQTRCYPAVELVFHPEANLVEYLFSPADIDPTTEQKALALAQRVIDELGMVGLLAVEMFLTRDGDLLVNEIAPRTHNSGHHTIEANTTSQFEQHLRAILDLPLGGTATLLPAAMVNVLGEDGFSGPAKYDGLDALLAMDGVHLHLYGKRDTKPFRKMGHITITDQDRSALREKVHLVRQTLKVIA